MQSDSIDQLATALAAAQGEFKTVSATHTARVQTRAGGEYSYRYENLADVLDVVRASLAKHQLAISQMVETDDESGDFVIATLLVHSSGQYLSTRTRLPIAETSDPRAVGSAISYYCRYALKALLGVAAAEDDDDAAQVAARPAQARAVVGDTAKAQSSDPSGSWLDQGDRRARFLHWAQEQGVSPDDELLDALRVESLDDYIGSPADAKHAVESYLAWRVAHETVEKEDAPSK